MMDKNKKERIYRKSDREIKEERKLINEYKSKKFFKVINAKKNHNGYQYVDGLNILDKPFQKYGSCVPGGLYFTDDEHIWQFVNYGCYVYEVTLPFDRDDFQMVKDGDNKWRANKIILGKQYPVDSAKKYFTIIDGKSYVNGLNIFDDFDDKESKKSSGFKFTDVNHILDFMHDDAVDRDACLFEVRLPFDDEDFKMITISDFDKMWCANKVILGNKTCLNDVELYQSLHSIGVNVCCDHVISWTINNNYLDIMLFLLELHNKLPVTDLIKKTIQCNNLESIMFVGSVCVKYNNTVNTRAQILLNQGLKINNNNSNRNIFDIDIENLNHDNLEEIRFQLFKYLISQYLELGRQWDTSDIYSLAIKHKDFKLIKYLLSTNCTISDYYLFGRVMECNDLESIDFLVRICVEKYNDDGMKDILLLSDDNNDDDNNHLKIIKLAMCRYLLASKKISTHGVFDIISGNSLQSFQFLVSAGVNITDRNFYACKNVTSGGKIKAIKFLIENADKFKSQFNFDISFCDNYAFKEVFRHSDLESIKCLVSMGIDITISDNFAIKQAAKRGLLDVVKYLVDHGADIHAEHDHAFRMAATKNRLDVVEYLITAGANITACHNSAVKMAHRFGHEEMVKFLIERGACLELTD